MLWGGWRESPVGWKVSPCTELLESGSRWGSHEERPGRLLRTSYFFYFGCPEEKPSRLYGECPRTSPGWGRGRGKASAESLRGGRPAGPAGVAESRCGNEGWGPNQTGPVPCRWPFTSFLSGLSTRGWWWVLWELPGAHSHLDEQSQAKRPPRRTVSARSHRRSQLSSDAPSGRLLLSSGLAPPLRDFRPRLRGEAGEGLDWCSRGAWKSGAPPHSDRSQWPRNCTYEVSCMWCDLAEGMSVWVPWVQGSSACSTMAHSVLHSLGTRSGL